VRHVLTLCCVCCATLAAVGQASCEAITEWQPGSTWVYQWFSADKKPAYTTLHRVLDQQPAPNRRDVQLLVVDAYQDTVHQSSYQVRCDSTGVYQDLLAKLTPDMLRTLSGVSLRSTGKGWQLPIGMQPGDSIPQAFDHIEGFNQTSKILEFDLAIGSVRILAQEDLATPAGGFPCVALAYELWITQVVRKQFRMRDWYAPGIGIIRREVFDRRGKFFGYCELVDKL
jgi:hypothetical protein